MGVGMLTRHKKYGFQDPLKGMYATW